jgi:hypothetical protein
MGSQCCSTYQAVLPYWHPWICASWLSWIQTYSLPSKMLRPVSVPVTLSPNKLVLAYLLLDTSTNSLVACLHHMSWFMLSSLLDSLQTLVLDANPCSIFPLPRLSCWAKGGGGGGQSPCLSIYRLSRGSRSLPKSWLSVCPWLVL